MKTITDRQYEEYKNLKRWAKRQKVWDSASEIQYLIDDVDAPIRKCVAMTALLGLEPLFSCCGFDYRGQPYHKSHQYGEPYIMLHKNKLNYQWIKEEKEVVLGGGWKIKNHLPNAYLIIFKVNGNPYWRKKDCIHFAEETVLGIAWLEKALLTLSEQFMDEIVLADTNQNYKKNGIRHWQYPPKEPWIIKKELLDTY